MAAALFFSPGVFALDGDSLDQSGGRLRDADLAALPTRYGVRPHANSLGQPGLRQAQLLSDSTELRTGHDYTNSIVMTTQSQVLGLAPGPLVTRRLR
jgi:hypothetical protein